MKAHVSMVDETSPPEQPRVEPEIIPPDRGRRQSAWQQSYWGPANGRGDMFGNARGGHRVHVWRMGPFGATLLLLAVAAFAAVLVLAFIGAVLIWIPVVAVLVVLAALARILRW